MQFNDYFNAAFIQQLMEKQFPQSTITVKEVKHLDVDNSASILVVLTAGTTEKPIGHFGLSVSFNKDGVPLSRNMVMKVKPHGDAIVEMLNSLAGACGPQLRNVYSQFKKQTGFQFTHLKEQEIYSKLPSHLTPEIFGLYTDPETNSYIILMEYLQEVDLLNSVMQVDSWGDEHIKLALKEIAAWHASSLNASSEVNLNLWTDAPSLNYMNSLSPLWNELLENAAEKFPELYNVSRYKKLKNCIENIETYWAELDNHPRTLIHNDFNPRNTCFKRKGNSLKLCAYDWELATFHLPQYDIVEFLSFVLNESNYGLAKQYLEYYREQLQRLSNKFDDRLKFEKGFYLSAIDFGLHRLGMYMMAHSVSPYPFLPRVVNTYFKILGGFDYESFFSNKKYLEEI